MKRMMLFLAAVAGILAAMFVAAPFVAPHGSYLALDGSPCFIDHSWSVSELPYLIGDVLCHQEQDRSFMLNGSQLPVCSRDLGLVLGLMLGCLLCLSPSVSMGRGWVATSCLMMCFTVVEWAIEPAFGNLMETRFATGVVSGAGVGMLVGWFAKRSVERFMEKG